MRAFLQNSEQMANFYVGDIVEAERRESKKSDDKSKPQSQPKYVFPPKTSNNLEMHEFRSFRAVPHLHMRLVSSSSRVMHFP